MWKNWIKTITDWDNMQDKNANICMDLIIEFRDRIKFKSYVDNQECDKRKLSDYTLQQFWNYLQTKKCFKL